VAQPTTDLPEADLLDLLGADFDTALLERLAINPPEAPIAVPPSTDDSRAA
jgi:hypothetical protein